MDNSRFSPFEKEPAEPRSGWRRAVDTMKKPWFAVLVTALVLLGVGALSVNRIMQALLHSRPEVVVPDLEGKSLMESLAIVSPLNLSLRQEGTEFNEGLPAGTIVRQHPPPGIRVRAGRAIMVYVSKGGQVVFVPTVIGRAITEAQSVLQGERLQMGAVTQVYSVDYPQGQVLSQSPSSGTMVTRGALIDVQVSKGLPPAGAPLVPDFLGQTADAVRTWASGVNAQVKVSEDPKALGVAGSIVHQDPPAGQPLLEGDPIKITMVPAAPTTGNRFVYKVPPDQQEVTIRIMARDNRGESQIYKAQHKGGDSVELPIAVNSSTRIRVYMNDALQEERVVEP